MANLNRVSIGYNPITKDIVLLDNALIAETGTNPFRIINQEFFDILEQRTRGADSVTFNVRGKNYVVRVECK